MQSLPMHRRQMDSSVLQLILLASIFYTEARDLYLLEGHHVKLDIHGHEDFRREDVDFVHWHFHRQVVRYYPVSEKLFVPDDRVEFDSTNFSMILKNLQKRDSGLYRGEISVSGNISSTKYNISVLEPVSTPNLTVVSNWSSADSCNVTLTCRGHDLSLTFICNGSTCTHKGGAIIDTTLVVVARDDHIVCNHSNQVSWRDTVLGIRQVCPIYFEQEFPLGDKQTPIWIYITVASGLVLLILVLGGVLHLKNEAGSSSAVYQSVMNALQLKSTVKGPSPIYCKVQPNSSPNTDLETPQPEHVSFVP